MRPLHTRGFTLTELAIALVIIAFLLGGIVVTLESQIASRNQAETRRMLDLAAEAVIGFAVQRGRLPCPATAASMGEESVVVPSVATPGGFTAATWREARGECEVADGFLPAATLGITPIDSQGFAIDAWGSNVGGLNRIRYAVDRDMVQINGNWVFAFTGKDAMKLAGFTARPNLLLVCTPPPGASSAGATVGDALDPTAPILFPTPGTPPACPVGNAAIRTPAVIYSLGPNGANAAAQTQAVFEASAASADERENYNTNPRIFVSKPAIQSGADTFDDLVTFVSVNVLYNRLVAANPL